MRDWLDQMEEEEDERARARARGETVVVPQPSPQPETAPPMQMPAPPPPLPPEALVAACCGDGPPDSPAAHEVLSRDTHEGWSELRVRCRRCQQRWLVVEDVGYHHPTYDWKRGG